MEDIVFIT